MNQPPPGRVESVVMIFVGGALGALGAALGAWVFKKLAGDDDAERAKKARIQRVRATYEGQRR